MPIAETDVPTDRKLYTGPNISKKRVKDSYMNGTMKLNKLMGRTLFRLFVVAIPLAVLAVWAGQSMSVSILKRMLIESNRDQLRRALVATSDRKMLDRAWKAARLLPDDGKLSSAQMERMLLEAEADEIHICDTNGVIVRSSVPEYLGFEFRRHQQTLPFCALLEGTREVAQDFGPIAYDEHRYRKYVGVALSRGGFLELGFNEDRYLPEPNLDRMRIVPVLVVMAIMVALFLAVIVAVYVFFRRRIISPISRANASLARIAAGNLNEKVLIGGSTEMDALADDINVTVNRLRGYIEEAEHRADAELVMAKSIQTNSLPSRFPPYPDLADRIDIFARMITAKEVGGDFYDFYFVGSGKLALVMADVSGKGIPAALFMMRAKATIQSYLRSGLGIVEAVESANRWLAAENDANMFVTAWIGIVDLATGEMEYVNAGHNPPLVSRTDGRVEYLTPRSGPPLAAMDGVNYLRQAFSLNSGDGLLLYTDGVTEAMNAAGTLYGEGRLLRTTRNLLGEKDERALIDGVLKGIESFVSGAEQTDDITMLGFKLVCR